MSEPLSDWRKASKAEQEQIRLVVEGLKQALTGHDTSIGVSGLVIILAELSRSLNVPVADLTDRAAYLREQLETRGATPLFELLSKEAVAPAVTKPREWVH